MRSNNATPLEGLRVIEFSHMVMGPSAGLVLADMGADVIKVEPPSGDKTRSLPGSGAGYFAMYNRNKRSICLNLKSDHGIEVAMRLVADADVLIENFRPGAMQRLGLDYPALSERNSRLIYCSTHGFLAGPYENRTALDEVAQMMGGLAYMTGPPGRPLRAGASVIDVMGGMFGVIGILAAIEERHKTGRGQEVKSALFESTAFLVGQHMAQKAVTGKPAAPMPNRVSAWAVYDVFETADNEHVFVGVVSDSQWQTFCREFQLGELGSDERLRHNTDRVHARETLLPKIRDCLAEFTKDKLITKLESCGLPFAPVSKPEDLFDDPHLAESGGLVDVNLPGGETASLPAMPLQMDGHRFQLRRDPPGAGQHSAEVLAEIGYEAREIRALFDEGVVTSSASDSGF